MPYCIYSALPDYVVNKHSVTRQEDMLVSAGQIDSTGVQDPRISLQQLKGFVVVVCFPYSGFSLSLDQHLKLHSILHCICQVQIRASISQKSRVNAQLQDILNALQPSDSKPLASCLFVTRTKSKQTKKVTHASNCFKYLIYQTKALVAQAPVLS